MDYQTLRSDFLDILNRDDITTEKADRFIYFGLRRTERLLRTPLQKATLTVTLDETYEGFIGVPIDFLSIDYLTVNDLVAHRITELQDLNGWYIKDSKFYFYPDLISGDTVKITYFNEFVKDAADSDITTYSLVIPDVIVYAALSYAGDTYEDSRLDRWEARLGALVQEVQLMADIDMMAGGVVLSNPYGGIV